eukprot:TRINITY_DN13920_c0_g1_i3.p1 TRINITY_DN13920_c0_g1~~TRINITY_DN13920_c0_g1_i3.p1  ORF type:complete len:175 (+),score=38.87 TRINITY_DN13920_c0_g1_i3:37-561(+)
MFRRSGGVLNPARRFKGYSRRKQEVGTVTGMGMGFSEACSVLGVKSSPYLTMDEVKAMRDKLVMMYHPDKTGGTTTAKWHEVQQAVAVLKTSISQAKGKHKSLQDSEAHDGPKVAAKGNNEWSNAAYALYRVHKWRDAKIARRHELLGTAVQTGVLEELLEAPEVMYEKDARTR